MALLHKYVLKIRQCFRRMAVADYQLVVVGFCAVLLRVYALGRLPGINGDEAWYGVQVDALLAGKEGCWFTPSGLPVNPLHSGVLLALQWIVPFREFWMLRFPSLVSGCAAMVIAYFLIKRVYDTSAALMAFVLFASLPVFCAYSRFGWDVSHMGLVVLVCCYVALSNSPVCCSLVFAMVLWVHPTGIFIAPILSGIFVGNWLDVHKKSKPDRRNNLHLLIAFAGIVSVAVLFLQILPPQNMYRQGWAARISDFHGIVRFVKRYGQFFSGTTVYRYIVGPVGPMQALLHDGLFWLCSLPIGFRAAFLFWKQRDYRELCFIAGTVCSVAVFYLVAGPEAIGPHVERYAMALAAPSCILFSVCAARVMRERGGNGLSIHLFPIIAAVWLMGSFSTNYLYKLETAGSASHRTFYSGRCEPKQAAFEIVTGHAETGKTVTLYLEDWWLYWPVKYLAGAKTSIALYDIDKLRPDIRALRPQSVNEDVFAVAFAGGVLDRNLRQSPFVGRDWSVNAGRPYPIVTVYQLVQ